MTLRNFDTELDRLGTTRLVVSTTTITEEVKVTSKPWDGSAWLAKAPAEWGWEELRDYVVQQIEARFGAFPRNFKTEHSIFKSFLSRWGAQAGLIAKAAFEVHDGYWAGAPISVNRFCKGSDTFFANEIAKNL